jgi:phospholipid-binding lipoprotein MlaA
MTTTRCLLAAAVAATVLLSGCATTNSAPSRADPFEPFNRVMYKINEPIDRDIIFPGVRAYNETVHPVVRQMISNFFGNIDDLFGALNSALQGKKEKAANDMGRVIVNTMFGLGGLIDFASEANIPRSDEDFGQTFGHWGIPAGPYLYVPLFGPSTVRDGVGWGVRAYLSPIRYIDEWAVRDSLFWIGYVDVRSKYYEAQQLVGGAALDPYTFARRSYLQRREYLTYDGQPPPRKDEDE